MRVKFLSIVIKTAPLKGKFAATLGIGGSTRTTALGKAALRRHTIV